MRSNQLSVEYMWLYTTSMITLNPAACSAWIICLHSRMRTAPSNGFVEYDPSGTL